MAGSATLDPNVLIDDLVPTIAELRDELHSAFGVRSYNLHTVVRKWNRGQVGYGDDDDYTDTEVLIEPQPLVHMFSSFGRDIEPCGYRDVGALKVTEVDLSYTIQELLATEAPAGSQHFIKLTEAHGQNQNAKYFVHAKHPYPDRIKDMGWVLWLELVEDEC